MKNFKCYCCGDCCSGNMSITLNLYDLYKMAKFLKLESSADLFSKGYVKLKTGQNGIEVPEIIFKKYPYKFCPFLINDVNDNMELKGFCSLHPYIKPLVCILAPISKVYDSEKKITIYSHTKPTEHCPGELYGDDIPEGILLKDVQNELELETQFYELLDLIICKKIENYRDILYTFNIEDDFKKTIIDIKDKLLNS